MWHLLLTLLNYDHTLEEGGVEQVQNPIVVLASAADILWQHSRLKPFLLSFNKDLSCFDIEV